MVCSGRRQLAEYYAAVARDAERQGKHARAAELYKMALLALRDEPQRVQLCSSAQVDSPNLTGER